MEQSWCSGTKETGACLIRRGWGCLLGVRVRFWTRSTFCMAGRKFVAFLCCRCNGWGTCQKSGQMPCFVDGAKTLARTSHSGDCLSRGKRNESHHGCCPTPATQTVTSVPFPDNTAVPLASQPHLHQHYFAKNNHTSLPLYNYAHKNFKEKLRPKLDGARARPAPQPRRTHCLPPLAFATPCTQIYCENTFGYSSI